VTISDDIIDEIIRYLEVEKAMGTEWIPVRKKPARPGEEKVSPAGPPPPREPPSPPVGKNPEARAAGRAPAAEGSAPLTAVKVPLSTRDEAEIGRKAEALAEINEVVRGCRKCPLHEHRTQTVFHDGHPAARLCFVGEGPGADEDATGVPFVGRAGKLLTKILGAMGMKREEVYICNTVKCRPPGNRTPTREEMETCWPYLEKQLQVLKPDVIVALGLPAAQALLRNVPSVSKHRGKWMEYRGIPVMLTYHPAYLLRNPAAKKLVWEDLKLVHEFLSKGKIEKEPEAAPSPASNLSLFKKL
jgi:uracil-DNA glycosylase family 4